jgi:hypothetical protein
LRRQAAQGKAEKTVAEEFPGLLKKHRIPYDERYLWE